MINANPNTPLLLFRFLAGDLVNTLQGIPQVGNLIASAVGFPVALYLNENLTGIYVQDEAKNLSIETNVQARNDKKTPILNQKGIENGTTINLIARRDSTFLNVLFALNDMVFARVVSKQYNVSYFNGPTLILNGLLAGFSTSAGPNDDLTRVQLQLTRPGEETATANVPTLEKVTGATPLGGL